MTEILVKTYVLRILMLLERYSAIIEGFYGKSRRRKRLLKSYVANN